MSETAESQALFTARELGVNRQGRWILHDLSLRLFRGKIVTLVGPNGSGKTTAAKLVLGVIAPDKGRLKRRPRLRLGYVPQKLTLESSLPLTVDGLFRLGGVRLSKPERRESLARVGLEGLEKRSVHGLSGGEFQRLLLARALARKPDLLVLDEPAQGVDIAGQVKIYDIIQDVREKLGCAVLLISHDLHFVMAGTDYVICLNGHICCEGTAEAVISHPEYARLFAPGEQEALAFYQHHHDHVHLPDGSLQFISDKEKT